MAKQLLLCQWGGPTNGTGLAHHYIIRTALRSLLPPCVRNYQMTLNGMKLKVISTMTFSVLLCWIYSIGGSKIRVVFAYSGSASEQRCKFIIAERSFKKSMIRLPQPQSTMQPITPAPKVGRSNGPKRVRKLPLFIL